MATAHTKSSATKHLLNNGHLSFDHKQLSSWARSTGRNVRSYAQKQYAHAAKLGRKMTTRAKAHPLQTLALAAAGGWLVGRLFGRR